MIANPPLAVPCLMVLVGPPGSGKSTWAKRNGRGAVHVSQDDLIDAFSPDGFEHVYRPIYGAAEDAVARTALEHGQTVIVDRTNRTHGHRRRWLAIADKRMERMIAAFEPVQVDEGFTAMFDDSATISEILESLQKETIHEYCDQAR